MNGRMNIDFSLGFLFLYCFVPTVMGLQCLSNSNQPVDWFIYYKLPHSVLKKDVYFYMDPSVPNWSLSDKTMQEKDHALAYTLEQLHVSRQLNTTKTGSMMYVMYNDAPHDQDKPHRSANEMTGHTKGVVAFDVNQGFWLVHSVPKFPQQLLQKGYVWPSDTHPNKYGQTLLCVTMDTVQSLDNIGTQLLYYHPNVYDNNIPPSFAKKYPNMAAVLQKKTIKSPPWQRETKLVSSGGKTFISFAKSAKFGADLYGGWLTGRFQQSLYVETWQDGSGGKLSSNCTGYNKVYNVATVKFKAKNIGFQSTVDHSKWAVTQSGNWICVGDINRMESQFKRGGGTLCTEDASIAYNFRSLVSTYVKCD